MEELHGARTMSQTEPVRSAHTAFPAKATPRATHLLEPTRQNNIADKSCRGKQRKERRGNTTLTMSASMPMQHTTFFD